MTKKTFIGNKMDSLTDYISLIHDRPELFTNTGEPGEIKIIVDPERIRFEQENIRKKFRAEGKPDNWIDIGVLAEDEWEFVVRDLVEFPSGRIGGYRRNINRKQLEGGTGVVMMPVQGEKVILLKHFRHESREWFWEFPRGWGMPGLTAEQNATKELSEEIGLLPQKLIRVWRDPATVFFYAKMQEGNPDIQNNEAIESIQKIEVIGIKELENWILDSKITDWCTILTFLMAQKKELYSTPA